MEMTGIVRKIDELGRIVIPKEIRRTLRIRQMDSIEIYVSKEGEIVLRKYAPMGAVLPLARDYAQALGRISGNVICITDRENVVAASGVGRELENMHITKEFADFLECRENRMLSPKEYIPVTEACRGANVSEIICPIISEGDLLGCVIMLGKDSGTRFDRIDEKIVAVAANFFELQFIS